MGAAAMYNTAHITRWSQVALVGCIEGTEKTKDGTLLNVMAEPVPKADGSVAIELFLIGHQKPIRYFRVGTTCKEALEQIASLAQRSPNELV